MSHGRIVIAGGSGFIGRALATALEANGNDVVILTRDERSHRGPGRAVRWDGNTIGAWAAEVDGADAVVNLAGKNVNCRYNRRNLEEIDQSRVRAVKVMAQAINRAARPPRVLVQASTTAIYGDANDRWCDESTPPGEGIPPRTATMWESAFHDSPTPSETRRVLLRMSFVLGKNGGALRMLARLTRCFLGGTVGSGRQFISWIHIDDLVRLIVRAISDESMNGLYNVASPNPVRNAEFMRELRRALGRPWSPRAPAWLVRPGCFILRTEPVLALTGRRVAPRRLEEMGFAFEYTDVAVALRAS
jgi:uncharacterized protein (TIGR01777 family)